jgi:hypothetical protein
MYVCMLQSCMYDYVHVYVLVCMYVCMYATVCMYDDVYVYVCILMCEYVCMYVRISSGISQVLICMYVYTMVSCSTSIVLTQHSAPNRKINRASGFANSPKAGYEALILGILDMPRSQCVSAAPHAPGEAKLPSFGVHEK